jgi:hypothetical protein
MVRFPFEHLKQTFRIYIKKSNYQKGYLTKNYKKFSLSLKSNFIAKQVYNWDGKLVRSLSDVPKLDKCLQSIVNEVEYAPLWISKGEAFDSRGALFFIENLLKFTKSKRKELVDKRKRLNNNLKFIQEEQMQIRTSAIRIIEINEALKPINAGIDEFNSAIMNLESVHSGLQSLNAEQMSNGYESLFKHIKSISTNEKIFGGQASKGVKLKVFFNGTDDCIDVFFNLKDWSVSNENSETQKSQLYQLLSEVNQKVNKASTKAIKYTRVFNEFGEEIKQVAKLTNNEKIWVSMGENWIGEGTPTVAVSLKLDMLFSMRNQIENAPSNQNILQNTEELHTENKTELKEIKEVIDDDNDESTDTDDSILKKEKKTREKNEKEEELTNFFKQYSPPKPFEKVENTHNSNSDSRSLKVFTEPLRINVLKKYEKSEFWDVLSRNECVELLNETAHEHRTDLVKEDHVQIENLKAEELLIQNKSESKLILYPQLAVNQKVSRSGLKSDSIWLHDFQMWKFTKNGFIYNQFFPKIYLTLNTSVTIQLEFHLKSTTQKMNKKTDEDSLLNQPMSFVKKGYAVILDTRHSGSEVKSFRDKDQQWKFNKYGKF